MARRAWLSSAVTWPLCTRRCCFCFSLPTCLACFWLTSPALSNWSRREMLMVLTHLGNCSTAAGQILFLTFGFTPQGVQLFEGAIFYGTQGIAQCLFDKSEASFKFYVGTAQGGFRINLEMSRQVDHGKQQIADFIGDRCRVIVGHGFEHFIELFTDLVQHRQGVRPVEPDLPGTLLQLGR